MRVMNMTSSFPTMTWLPTSTRWQMYFSFQVHRRDSVYPYLKLAWLAYPFSAQIYLRSGRLVNSTLPSSTHSTKHPPILHHGFSAPSTPVQLIVCVSAFVNNIVGMCL